MIYELILTDKCNRKCDFCYIEQTGYFESKENIQLFYDLVQKENEGLLGKYTVNLFGGEPLLNHDGVCLVVDLFSQDKRCSLNIITNGDLILTDEIVDTLRKTTVNISTYDIFDECGFQRYKILGKLFGRCKFLYTLTENDIDRYWELKKIYSDLNVDFSIHFSHCPKSWAKISDSELYKKIYDLFFDELVSYRDNFHNLRADNFINIHLSRFIQNIVDDSMNVSYCVNNEKRTFYMGKFVGPCIRLKDIELGFTGSKCFDCEYRICCTRGCYAEISQDVNNKLCIIEKARFDAVKHFLEIPHINTKRIIQLYSDATFKSV